mmetsp:Transcript_5973/g.16036  ORF Transcript_5973/g.16036 Transcript_5973/m.16036 type:complete len:211 (+) Transcript_5973:592-1224(+)
MVRILDRSRSSTPSRAARSLSSAAAAVAAASSTAAIFASAVRRTAATASCTAPPHTWKPRVERTRAPRCGRRRVRDGGGGGEGIRQFPLGVFRSRLRGGEPLGRVTRVHRRCAHRLSHRVELRCESLDRHHGAVPLPLGVRGPRLGGVRGGPDPVSLRPGLLELPRLGLQLGDELVPLGLHRGGLLGGDTAGDVRAVPAHRVRSGTRPRG